MRLNFFFITKISIYFIFSHFIIINVSLLTASDKGIFVKKTDKINLSAYKMKHALIIGINNYKYNSIPDLSYSENDAVEISKILKEIYDFEHVTTLIGKKATKDNIIDQIADLSDPTKVSKEDAVLIYFSGHGVTVDTASGEQGYLLPVDAKVSIKDVKNPAPFRRHAIRMDDLRVDSDAILARHVLFLIDACYSGYFSTKAVIQKAEISNALKYNARQVITAGTKNEEALEDNTWKHGIFTYKLLEYLRNENEPIAATALGAWLKKTVPREVSNRLPNYSLTPQVKYLSGDGDFYFIRKDYLFNINDNNKFIKAKQDMNIIRKIIEAQLILKELEHDMKIQEVKKLLFIK